MKKLRKANKYDLFWIAVERYCKARNLGDAVKFVEDELEYCFEPSKHDKAIALYQKYYRKKVNINVKRR